MSSDHYIVPDRRMLIEFVQMTRKEKADWKRNHVRQAEENVRQARLDKPPETRATYTEIGPDHPRWKDGMSIAVRVISCFKMKVPKK